MLVFLQGCRECYEIVFPNGYSAKLEKGTFEERNGCVILTKTGQILCDVSQVRECK